MSTLDELDVRIAILEAEIAGYKAEYKTSSSEKRKDLLLANIAAARETLNLRLRDKARRDAAGIRYIYIYIYIFIYYLNLFVEYACLFVVSVAMWRTTRLALRQHWHLQQHQVNQVSF
jgi:hypothetical protein